MDNGSGASGSRIADADSPNGDLTGQVIGDFRVLRRLGQGGMGHVYLAEQISLKRKVALKVLKAELAANPISLQRFKTEAENVARATHANIVQVYASISANGLHYIALEYVEGRNLRDYLTHKGPPDLALTLSIMRQVASALQRASELGIIHRDIKPENILLTRKGEVKVADFGLARCLAPDQQPSHLTQSGVSMGTPLYMSPEQVEGRPIDPRSDIYSFGVTCYHMLTGQPPYQGATAFAVAMQHVQGDPTPLETIRPDLPAELCAIVKKMMAKEPSQRHQTATELLKDLIHLRESTSGSVSGLQTQPLDLSSPEIAAKPTPTVPIPTIARRWLPWIVAASLVLALLGGAGIAWLSRSGESTPSSSGLPTSNFETDAIDAMFSPQKREQVLLSAVEMHLNPGTDPQRIRLGLSHCAELGVFYLEQHRLDSAERFFSKLEAHSVRTYRTLGRLGHSLVLAFQDKPEESNAMLLDFLREKKTDLNRKELDAMLRQNPRLAQMVAQAQEYNVANATAEHPYPRELDYLRKPPVRRPGADKPSTKGG